MISGSIVFRNALLRGGGSNLPYKLFGFQMGTGGETQQVGEGWDRRFDLEKGIKEGRYHKID
jgi:hypothetical protein